MAWRGSRRPRRADGAHAGLHERQVRRLRLGATASGRAPTTQRGGRREHRALPAAAGPRRRLAHPHDHPAHDRQATDARSSATGSPSTRSARRATASSCAARRVLATLAPFADEIAVYPGFRCPPEASAYALAFAIPVDTPGLIFLCRDSASTPGADPFDRPLSSRFDEQDAFVIFDESRSPRPRLHRRRRRHLQLDGPDRLRHNMTNQTTIRALTKLEFAYGLATRMAETISDQSPATLRCWASCLLRGGHAQCRAPVGEQACDVGDGMWFPGRAAGADAVTARRVVPAGQRDHHAHRQPQPAGHAEPRRARRPALRPLLDEILHGANGVDAEDRAALFRLAWDFVGSTLGRARASCTSASTSPRPAATASAAATRLRPQPRRMRSSTTCSPPAATPQQGRDR